MAEKLHVRLKPDTMKRLRAFIILGNLSLEAVVSQALAGWVTADIWKPAPEKLIDAVLPCTEDGKNFLEDGKALHGMSASKVVEEALEFYLDQHFQMPTIATEKLTSDPPESAAPAEPATSRSCHCTQCGYHWTPKGKSEPAYCPKCRSKEWAKVVLCENSCERPIAPLNTDAGQSNMCEPCYREMKASWGPEEL